MSFKLKPGFVKPKKIFIWKSYGNVEVYLIDTEEKYADLRDKIIGAVEDWGIPDLDKQGINDIITQVGGVGCHEMFEYGTGWSTLK